MPETIPAIIAKDFEDLKNKIKLVEPYVKTVQLDIMDGVFVANKTWNKPEELASLETNLFLEVHLMVAEPEKVINGWLASKVKRIILHWEALESSKFSPCGGSPEGRKVLPLRGISRREKSSKLQFKIQNLIDEVCQAEKKIGLAINPETPAEVLYPYINNLDLVLLMSVNPGFAGQPFQESVIPKIAALRQKYPDVKIEVDGGVNSSNVLALAKAGADFLAVGSAIFESKNIGETIREFKSILTKSFL